MNFTNHQTILNDFIIANHPEQIADLWLRFIRGTQTLYFAYEPRSYSLMDTQFSNDFLELKILGSIDWSHIYEKLTFFMVQTHELNERTSKAKQFEIAKFILNSNPFQDTTFAIFIFYDLNGNKRISFIEKIFHQGKTQFSNYKRYTFFVSPNIPNHTFLQQLDLLNFDSPQNVKNVFSVEPVTKAFYAEIQNWYFSALQKIQFPNNHGISEQELEVLKATHLIRLITRLVFVWFIKQKNLVPDILFDENELEKIIKNFGKSGNYYHAILQNLFFATLNQKPEHRKFANHGEFHENRNQYFVKNLYRYADKFWISETEVLELFANIPFLNGGLFDCLDYEDKQKRYIVIDGFSRNSKYQVHLEDASFFSENLLIDLNKIYGTKNNQYPTRGLINILKSYNFTVEENTPVEEEIALDPELLGKVFENLLASYNPETQTTARKATGSFYTPREIVDYMVEEALVEYLKSNLSKDAHSNTSTLACENPSESKDACDALSLDARLRTLLSYNSTTNPFNETKTLQLIHAINNCKILDPACGSGAFPMGILHKMVNALQKLDPQNLIWKQIQKDKIIGEQIQKLNQDKIAIHGLSDEQVKQKALQAVEQRLKEIEEIFNQHHHFDDYSRKLFLIENCIYGIDIQTIAVQITKLRFFISLVIDQKVISKDIQENRGIRPLPNLETKFIAANTLIGLEKPIQRNLSTQLIEEKENKLKHVRHQYFTASSREQKLRLQEKDRELRQEIAEVLIKSGWNTDVAIQIADFNPYDQNARVNWFDAEWMFGLVPKSGEEGVFDIVIGNPPYVSTKGVPEKEKKVLLQQFGFADDLYNHFYFKSIQLLKEKGILTFISSKTFWTIQTKKNLRELLIKNKLLQLADTANPFQSAMVDTCITLVQKVIATNYTISFIDISNGWDKKQEYKVKDNIYKEVVNNVFFVPNDFNMKIYEQIGKKLKTLMEQWWDKISTSRNIEKYKTELEKYRQSLKPGDVTLLGLITEGGVGIQTGNNGKYVGVLEGTKWADKIRQERPQKLWEFIQNKNPKALSDLKSKNDVSNYLDRLSEKEVRELFDELKEKYGRDIFGQGWLYRIVSLEEIADVETLTEDEKLNGISGNRTFVPYDKGDKEGNRWWAPTPYYIDWSKENVKFLKENSGKKGEGMPVVRNPQFYFREGFCWNLINATRSTVDLKVRFVSSSIYDVGSMRLLSNFNSTPNYLIVCILNSKLENFYAELFLNFTLNFQINDARQLPIIIPTQEQLKEFEGIFDRAVVVQKQKFAKQISEKEADEKLEKIQKELDEKVLELYGLKE